MQKTTSLITAVCAALLAPAVALGVPLQVAHQGEVEDSSGAVTATLEFTFSLYDAAEDGNEVWSEDRTVDVVDGDYSVLLGSETAIDSVLFVEPALYLQIAIEDGEPLLPRQPVASAPYAVVAHTAENVSGGTVDASSISVNGTSVVNSEGDWIGPAGSIDWSAVTGAPADSDTLGGLSCADGDRAVWNDSSTQWECGSSLVPLDRLDVAGASDGQVLTYDGANVLWQDASSSSGSPCSLDEFAEDASYAVVDCGGTSMILRTWKQFMALAVGNNHTCGLGSAGVVQCWGVDVNGQSSPPVGLMTQIVAGAAHSCGLLPGGSAVCWGSDTQGQASVPAGTFVQLTAGASHTCGVTTTGAVLCWGSDAQGQLGSPGGSFSQVSAGQQHTCGIRTSGSLECWGWNSQGQSSPPAGTFATVSAGYTHSCGLDSAGGLLCWGSNTYGAASPPAGTFSQLGAAAGFHSCAVTTGGDAVCWGHEPGYGATLPPAGTFTSVEAGSYHSCGLRPSGAVACWGDPTTGKSSPP